MIKDFTLLMVTLGFFHLETARGQLSCYQCNVDSSRRFTQDCTDPYVPTPLDHLLPCPEDEPHQCLTAVILYNSNDVTVRACVPSRLRDTYCADSNFLGFSGAKVNCTFCEADACNDSTPKTEPCRDLVLALVVFAVVNFRGVIFGF